MDPNSIRNIQPGQPVDRSSAPGAPTGDSTEFRRLLETLERLSAERPAAPADDRSDSPEDLKRDLEKADDEFRSVMDLRRRLEDAFRNLGP